MREVWKMQATYLHCISFSLAHSPFHLAALSWKLGGKAEANWAFPCCLPGSAGAGNWPQEPELGKRVSGMWQQKLKQLFSWEILDFIPLFPCATHMPSYQATGFINPIPCFCMLLSLSWRVESFFPSHLKLLVFLHVPCTSFE